MRKSVLLSATITVASGIGSTTASTESFFPILYSGGKIKQIIFTAVSEITNYDFYITNPNSKRIYQRKNNKGSIDEGDDVTIPAGNYTFGIENATEDGDYSMEITYEAEW